VGAGPGEPDTGDGDELGVADMDGAGDTDGVGERLGCGRRDGLGERAGLEADGVGLGTEVGVPVGWAATRTGGGRTRM
jgi:hypothetical protein